MSDLHYLYAIRLPVNDYAVAYIGVSKQPRRRFTNHFYLGVSIGEAIRQCGREDVVFQLLAAGNREFIYDLEVKAIETFATRVNGYNMNAGGFGGRDPLPQSRRKMSEKSKLHPPPTFKGRKHSAESNKKRSESLMGERNPNWGKKHSSESNAKRALALRGNTHTLGRKLSPEHRAKISAGLYRHHAGECHV